MALIGAILVDKPAGITSHDVVAKLRYALKERRIGHTGTLDPFATGLLMVCVGRATRLVQFLTIATKAYEAVVRIGFSTDTQDYTGKPNTPINSSDELTVTELRRILSQFVGEQLQLPPMFSAKKVAGEALYKRARRGETIERQAVKIVIHQAELLMAPEQQLSSNADGTRDVVIKVVCSAGTYIRTLAHDLGERLGYGAHLTQLRRVAIGDFSIEDAIRLDELVEMAKRGEAQTRIIPPAALIVGMPTVHLDAEQVVRVRAGQTLANPLAESRALSEPVRMLDEYGDLIAIAEVVEKEHGRRLQPRSIFVD